MMNFLTKASDPPCAKARRWPYALMVVLLAGLSEPPLAWADRDTQAARFYEDALTRHERHDETGAIVQLKNALQQDPKMLPALVLLGKAYLKVGQALGAERVLAEAERLGADRSEIIVSQVEAYHLLGRNKELLERFLPDGLPPAVRYQVLVTRAYAQMDIGKEADAIQSANQARQIDPNKPSALVAQSMAYLSMNRFADASVMARQSVTKNPSDPSGWNMMASIAHEQGNVQEALNAYGKALTLDPGYLEALIARASLLLDMKRDKEAARDIGILKQKFGKDPRSAYLQALLAGRQGKDVEVRNALVVAAGALDALPFEAVRVRPQLLLLGGVAHYSLGQNEKAKTYLDGYLQKFPRHMGALKLRTAIMMGEKNYAEAIALLEGPASAAQDDPQALSMLATCYMALNQHAKAVALLNTANELSGGVAPDITANFGLGLIGSGQVEQGVAQLQKAFSEDPGRSRSGVPLALMYMKQGKTQSALKIIETVVKNEPDNLTALNVLGIARGLSGDRAGARKAYEQILARNGSIAAARLNLARLDLVEGKPGQARTRLLGILKDEPSNQDAYFELAQVEMSIQRPLEAIRWLQKARSYNPQSLGPNLMLVDLYLGLGDAGKALDIAKDVQASSLNNLQALAALGRAYLAVGNRELARQNFRTISQVAGFNADWQQRAAQLQMSAGDYEGARYSLEKALLSKPGYFPALLLRATLDRQSGNLDSAEKQARELASRYPRESAVPQLLGDIALQRGNYRDAIAAYDTAYRLNNKNPEHATSLYRAYSLSGQRDLALQFAQSWARSLPSDATAARLLAEAYLAAGRYGDARVAYERLLTQNGNDPLALNNLANILLTLGDKGAQATAERAYKLAPQDPNIADTLGWILVKSGQAERALKFLREARIRAPGSPAIREHLAQALEVTGRTAEARIERAAIQGMRGTP